MSFPCTKCGACCAKVRGEPWSSTLPLNPDGSCQHYDPSSKECKIYSTRPNMCRMDYFCPPHCWEWQEDYCDRIHLDLYKVPRERGKDCTHTPLGGEMKDAVLVLGAGNSTFQRIGVHAEGTPPPSNQFGENFKDVWTIDFDPASKPKVLWDLETSETSFGETNLVWPVPKGFFDEVHGYEILEHLGGAGNFTFFFALWRKIWDTLKPGGLVCATTPWWESVWAWGDPGHKMVYSPALLVYLNQQAYFEQIGRTSMTDYRRLFPPPYSFITRKSSMTNVGTTEFDPKNAGFSFVLQKEEWKHESKN